MGLLDSVNALHAGLDYHLARQNVLSANVAEAWRLIEGLIFVGVIIFLPAGVVGTVARVRGARRLLAGSIGVKGARRFS